jgi:hypothetical protein
MLDKIRLKKSGVLAVILALSILLMTATTAFAITKLIKADKGGVVPLCQGAKLVIAPGALAQDTAIFAEMVQTEDSTTFTFGPSGTQFAIPAELDVTWKALGRNGKDKKYAESIVLYNEDGEVIDSEPEISSRGVVWDIEHFSIYYHRRR